MSVSPSSKAPASNGGLSSLMARRIRGDVQSMHAYAVQDSRGMVKLDAMENPYTLPAALQTELGQRLARVEINRYPGVRLQDLRDAMAQHTGLPDGSALMLGNGSDELISLLAMACDVPGASILAPVPGFVMYAMSAQLQGLAFHGVPLTANFELDEAAMVAAMRAHQPAITYLAYPNNPTANLWDAAVIRRLIAEAAQLGGIVVMDEAYQPFASRSWIDEMRRDPAANAHVLLMRTLSKFGLAGVRLGYMAGAAPLIAEIDKVRPPYNVSVLNAECALFALEHAEVFAQQSAQIRTQRAALTEALAGMPGLTVFPSEANMVLVRLARRAAGDDPAQRVFDGLRARGVLVKNVSKMHPLLVDCLRLTVGTAEQNARLLTALKEAS